MTNDVQGALQPRALWRRRVWITVASLCALLIIFHRPLLLGLGRRIGIHYAAKHNWKAEFRVEGSVFTNLTIRNLHVVAIGPSGIESIDADRARVDYSLWTLFRHGFGEFIDEIEVHNGRIVLDPVKAPPRIIPPKPDRKQEIVGIFPRRVLLDNVDVIVRNRPHDFVVEKLYADFNPIAPGELAAARVQLSSGQQWVKLHADTTYKDRNAFIRGLVFDDANKLAVVNFDGSRIREKALVANLDATLGGGHATGALEMHERNASIDVTTNFTAEHVGLAPIAKFFGKTEQDFSGDVERVEVHATGLLNSPHTWTGTATATVNQFKEGNLSFDRITLTADARDGKLILEPVEVVQGESAFRLRGSAELPKDPRELGRTPCNLELAGAAIDLQKLTARMPRPLTGIAQLNGHIEIRDAKLAATLLVSAGAIGFPDGTTGRLVANLRASKILPPPDTKEPWFTNLTTAADVDLLDVRFRDYHVDEIHGPITTSGDRVSADALTVRSNQNVGTLRGTYRLPADFKDVALQPASAQMNLHAVQLGDFWVENAADKISGLLDVNGEVSWDGQNAEGGLNVQAPELRLRELVIRGLSGQFGFHGTEVQVNDLKAALGEKDFVIATGAINWRPPYAYHGRVVANISDLTKLRPVIDRDGSKHVAGNLTMEWNGSGEALHLKNSGALKLTLSDGRFANLQKLRANIDASYTPDGLDVPIVFLASDKMDFQASVTAKGETLEISKIQLDQGKAKYAAGYIALPFVWRNIGTDSALFPSDGKVVATFQTENLDLKKLFEDIGAKPVAGGLINVKLDAQGTLQNLAARLDVQATNLQSDKVKNFEPGKLTLTAETKQNQLNVTGRFEQAKIQPVTLAAQMPLEPAKVLRSGRVGDDTPVQAKIQMPRSSVNFVRQFVPALQTADGDVALDVNVGGTIGKPVLSGAGDININIARFSNPTLPALTNFKSRLRFANDALTIERLGGDLAGGPFTIGGRVTFVKLTDPQIDLQLKATSVLVARNDSLTARADADVRVVGPLSSATVTGNVALTNSQFLKDIDLIPIGLPGRPPPQAVNDDPEISFPNPPLRDWKFDVAIKTKDPFMIRGNLANGGAISDLHFTGTGLHPGIAGMVRLENVEATLPFSRLEIQYGYLYFDPSDSFNPKLDLHGTSVIRDYTIHVYVYGTKASPQAVFTSEPPLPQEEIISLLATGTTREELTGNNNVLAGRAAMLLIQQLYHRVFKKGEAAQTNSVFDKLQVDLGGTDPRTGQQQATARFKINQQFVLVGDIGVGGDFRGQVKYLLRFK